MNFFRLFPLLFLVSCATSPFDEKLADAKIEVDISQQKLIVRDGNRKVFETSVETGRSGIGSTLGSNKTPVGEFTVTKEPNHRFGPTLRLSGYQGYKRGILIHRDFIKGNGTSGCICPDEEEMKEVFKLVSDDTPLTIRA